MLDSLRTKTILLAHKKPELRFHLLPLLAKTAAVGSGVVRGLSREILSNPKWFKQIKDDVLGPFVKDQAGKHLREQITALEAARDALPPDTFESIHADLIENLRRHERGQKETLRHHLESYLASIAPVPVAVGEILQAQNPRWRLWAQHGLVRLYYGDYDFFYPLLGPAKLRPERHRTYYKIKKAAERVQEEILDKLIPHLTEELWVPNDKRAARKPRFTMTGVRKALAQEMWRNDPRDRAWEYRSISFYSVGFEHKKHTGTKEQRFVVTWYTGDPGRRWNSETVSTLKKAVQVANREKAQSDLATAKELGEDPTGKL